jgi:DNA mismatch repair protein MutS
MQQYWQIKKDYPDTIVLFRMGDFYEMFDQDAEVASRVLQITLTSRRTHKEEKGVPMCGVPHHAVDSYLAKLVRNGFRVAICEQLEDPKLAKGLVKRDVIRVVTPGTVLDTRMLEAKENNFIVALTQKDQVIGMALLDISTGEFRISEFRGSQKVQKLKDELERVEPKEILVPETGGESLLLTELFGHFKKQGVKDKKQETLTHGFWHPTSKFCITHYPSQAFLYENAERMLREHFKTASLSGFGCQGLLRGISAAGALLSYIQETQKTSLDHIRSLRVFNVEEYMVLDAASQRNLELTRTILDHSRQGSLLGLLDCTMTAMGGRTLQAWLKHPLLDLKAIEQRLEAIAEFKDNLILRGDLRELLDGVYDLERLIGRLTLMAANARDLVALKLSIWKIPAIKNLLQSAITGRSSLIQDLIQTCDELSDIGELIDRAIVNEPPITLREGGLIKEGYNQELDELRKICREGKDWIAHLEQTERQRTRINSLKVRYNKVFGYFIEVTNPNLSMVPEDYITKQTLVNCVRFITPALKEYEAKVLGAEERIVELEYQLFQQIRESVSKESERILKTARALAQLDVLSSLAEVAARYNYTRPQVNDGDKIEIIEGRHPVVEQLRKEEAFIPNDVYLDTEGNTLLIITGPNMAGKSTFLRQVALIVLMAQIGSFVPAKKATIGLVDRIFTRVGASDNLTGGESTFMVEMNETANILNNATRKSLIILDEIGRGTSTYDGLSIAWAVAEYIANKIGAKTLFATHYHELTELASTLPGVQNYNVAVKEQNDEIIFLRKIVKGGTDRSYGIQVARLAGLPSEVLQRAKEILSHLEAHGLDHQGVSTAGKAKKSQKILKNNLQLTLFTPISSPEPPSQPHPVIEELKSLNVNTLTPLEALNKLAELQKKVES